MNVIITCERYFDTCDFDDVGVLEWNIEDTRGISLGGGFDSLDQAQAHCAEKGYRVTN